MREKMRNHMQVFWQKYRSGVLMGIALGTLIYLAVTVAGNLSAQAAFAGVTVNVRLSEKGSAWLCSELGNRLTSEGYRGKTLLTDAELEAFETVEDLDTNYYALQALLLLYETQELDVMLLDQVAMENFLRQEVFLDLRQLFPEDKLAALGEAVVYARSGEETEARPLVLDVSELPFIRDNAETDGKIYFAVMNNTPHLQECRLLWDVMTAWEDAK